MKCFLDRNLRSVTCPLAIQTHRSHDINELNSFKPDTGTEICQHRTSYFHALKLLDFKTQFPHTSCLLAIAPGLYRLSEPSPETAVGLQPNCTSIAAAILGKVPDNLSLTSCVWWFKPSWQPRTTKALAHSRKEKL